jgi:hypothetical protein
MALVALLLAMLLPWGGAAQTASGAWGERAEMLEPNSEFAVAELERRIYVLGGYPADRVTVRTVQVYSGVNGVLAHGCFHVWGGEGARGMFPDHTVYDPRSDRWTRLPDMPVPVHGVTGAAFVDGLIRLPGGGTAVGGSSNSTLNQVYEPAIRCE